MEKKSKRKRISVPGTGPVATSNVKKISSGMLVANELKSEENQSYTETVAEGGLMQEVKDNTLETEGQIAVNAESPVQVEKTEPKGRKPKRAKKKDIQPQLDLTLDDNVEMSVVDVIPKKNSSRKRAKAKVVEKEKNAEILALNDIMLDDDSFVDGVTDRKSVV